jgi:hypothetical protein
MRISSHQLARIGLVNRAAGDLAALAGYGE